MPAMKSDLREKARLLPADLRNVTVYNHEYRQAGSFYAFAKLAKKSSEPDAVRHGIFYLWQPLFDGLFWEPSGERRERALGLLDSLTAVGRTFLSGYYQGSPQNAVFNEWLEASESDLAAIDGMSYRRRQRNLDRFDDPYMPTPDDVLVFLRKLLQTAGDGIEIPDYIIGCACGATEIAMALAELLECNLGFVKFSKDSGLKVVPEHVTAINENTAGKKVISVEDIVRSGENMAMVMRYLDPYGPSSLIGAAPFYQRESDWEMAIGPKKGLNILRLKKKD